MKAGNLLWIGVFLLGCGQDPAPKSGSEQSIVVPRTEQERSEQERPADEQERPAEDEGTGLLADPSMALAKTRAAGVIETEASWTKAWEQSRYKIAPCAPAVSVLSEPEAPDSTHKEGEKYYTYLAVGVDEYRSGKPMPYGAAVIKRTFLPSSKETTGYFLMIKEEGANPAGGDWLYATLDSDKKHIRAGVLSDCANCHNKQSAKDFLFRAGG